MNAVQEPLTARDAPADTLRWTHRYAALGPAFYTRLAARPLPQPHWVATSDSAAASLGWPADWAERPEWRALEVLAGGTPWDGTDPLATVYSGHQFGVWAGQLGDGRALLLGEIASPSRPDGSPTQGQRPHALFPHG